MFKDTLKDDIFNQENGKNYRKAKKLDLNKIRKKLERSGYKVISIDQYFRNAHAIVEKNRQRYSVKVASTEAISERVKNELFWNREISSRIKKDCIDFFFVPEIIESGKVNNLFYYIGTLGKNDLLANKNPARINNLSQQLDNIVKANIFLLRLPNISFPRDTGELAKVNRPFAYLYNQDDRLQKVLPDYDLGKIIRTIKKVRNLQLFCVNHGDFVPWHMFDYKTKFLLIDGEHGSSKMPPFYDVAYFYHRVYTGAESPKIADLYLGLVRKSLNQREKRYFDICFWPCLADRIIGGLWHMKNENGNPIYHIMLIKMFEKTTSLSK